MRNRDLWLIAAALSAFAATAHADPKIKVQGPDVGSCAAAAKAVDIVLSHSLTCRVILAPNEVMRLIPADLQKG